MVNKVSNDELARRCAEAMLRDDEASRWLCMDIKKVSLGEAVVSMEIQHRMLNGHGTCHGGFVFTLADSAFAFACNSWNQRAVASNCTIDFMRPCYEGDVLTAHASMMHQGKRAGIYDVSVVNQNNECVAQFRGRSARVNSAVLD